MLKRYRILISHNKIQYAGLLIRVSDQIDIFYQMQDFLDEIDNIPRVINLHSLSGDILMKLSNYKYE